jgi:hypothetical protein
MNKSEQINELALALAKAQGQMSPAKMEATNPFLHNKYADLGSVIQAARKPLSENGLSFSQHPTIEAGRVSVCTVLMHSSGQWLESVIDLPVGEEKGLSLAQSMGKVVTYLRRYSLSAILGIYADEDTDGNDDKPSQASRRGNGNGAQQRQPAATTPANGTTTAPTMSRETAENVTNSKGERYGDLESTALENMIHGINKGLKKEGLTLAQKEEYQLKLAAIAVILGARETEDDAARAEMTEGADA